MAHRIWACGNPAFFLRLPRGYVATVREEAVRQLIRQPESHTLEFKSYTPDMATLLRLFSTFKKHPLVVQF
jgi:hypothetical protein